MSTAARPSRSRRGRVLLVGDPPQVARFASRLAHEPLRSPNLFDALGRLTTSPADQPIATLIVDERILPRDPRSALEALRKLDPAVRIVLVQASEPVNDAAWLARGVDECIAPPERADDFCRLFEEDMLRPASAEAKEQPLEPVVPPVRAAASDAKNAESRERAAKAASPAPEPAASAREKVREQPQPVSPEPLRPQIEILRPPVQEFAAGTKAPLPAVSETNPPPAPETSQQQPQSSSPAAPTESANEPLGDTDLVEAVLAGDGSIRPLALRLLAQQTGWTDAALVDAAPVGARLDAGVVVEFRGYAFGQLAAASAASAEAIKPWADWLARWLALDAMHQGLKLQSMQDELTGAWNRRFFEQFLRQALADAAKARRPVTLMVFDIDNFKTYNDRFGHEAGDEILRETVRLLNSVIRQGDRVCRIGGDEFVVIFADPEAPRKSGAAASHPETVDVIARRFQDQICSMRFPKLGIDAPGDLSISAGLATFPWDGGDAVSLLRHADALALESKRKGKNAITLGPGAQSACRRH